MNGGPQEDVLGLKTIPVWRLVLALMVSGPAAGLLAGVGLAAISILSAIGAAAEGLGLMLVFGVYGALFGAAFGWPISLLLGLPAHALLMAAGRREPWAYIGAGVAVGVITALVFAVVFDTGMGFGGDQTLLILPFAGSVIASALFWWIRRPDRDPPATPPETLFT